MMIEDIIVGYSAREELPIVVDQRETCALQLTQQENLTASHAREASLFKKENSNLREEISKEKEIADNRVKIEKQKTRKWRWISILETAGIVLLIVALL